MKNLFHVNVLRILGICLNCDGSPCIILPYMQLGDLRSYIKKRDQVFFLLYFYIDFFIENYGY